MMRSSSRRRSPAARLVVAALGLALSTVCLSPSGALAESPPLVPGESTGNDPDEAAWVGITLPTDGVLPDQEQHPSLYGGEQAIQAWRDRANDRVADPHGYYADVWEKIEADADAWADQPVDAADDVKTKAAKATAFAWLMTGDQRYLDAAVANLEAAFDEINAVDQYVALQMTNYAQAYDWVAADLDADQDAAVRAAVKRGADWLYEYLDDDGVRSHNHRSKSGAALGSWALAFSSDGDAQAYLDRALENLDRVFSYMFTKDGIYRDGGGYYWVFSIVNVTPFLWQYKNVSGVDLFPAMRPAYQWQLETANPKGWTPNIEDGSYKATWLNTVAAAYRDTPTELNPDATLGELFQWQFFSSEWNPVRYPDDWTGARDQYYGWPDELALYDSAIEEVAPDDSVATRDLNAGPRGGATVFRSDWQYGDAGTRYGYFNGVAMSNNHDHADGLQLIVEAENSILARDNGYGPAKFGSRDEWKGPEHHNVVTADGAAVGDPTPTRGFLSGDTFGFAEKGANYWDDDSASQTRSVAFPGQEYFIVADRLHADANKTWDAYWHGRGELTGAANRHTWTTEQGPWGDAARLHAFTLPADASQSMVQDRFNPYGTGTFVGFEGYPDPETDVEDTTGLKLTQTGQRAEFLSVLVPGPADGQGPATTDIGDDSTLAARIDLGDHIDEVAVPRSGTQASAGTLSIDAALGWVRTAQGSMTSWAMHDGSRLDVDGTTQVTADEPVTMSADLGAQRRQAYEIADLDGEVNLSLHAPAGRELLSAELDGVQQDAEQVDGDVVLTLDHGGRLVLAYQDVTDVPAAPAALSAVGGDGSVTLDWSGVPTATRYEIIREDQPASVATIAGTEWTDTDVVNGETFTYRVRAVNEAGTGPASDPASATPEAGTPAAPEGLTALARDSAVELSWLTVDGADGYEVLRGEEGGDLSVVAETVRPDYVDTGLENGQTYDYAVRAVNANGAGEESDRISASPYTTPPDVVEDLVATRSSDGISLSWAPAERARSYQVLRGVLGGDLSTVADDVSGPQWTDDEAEPGTAYVYRLVAQNSAGTSEPSTSVATAPGCTLTHELPSTGAVIETEQYSGRSGPMQLADDLDRFDGRKLVVPEGSEYKNDPDLWVRYDLDVAEAGRYYLQILGYGEDGSSDSVTMAVDGETPFTMNLGTGKWSYRQSARALDLTAGAHEIRVMAREDGAEVDRFVLHPDKSIPESVKQSTQWSHPRTPECDDGSASPEAPAPVSSVDAEGGDGTVVLTWSGSRRAASYEVRRDGTQVQAGVTGNSWRDDDVVNGQEYRYVVVAVNRAGEASSDGVTARPLPPPPPTPEGVTGHWRGRFPVLDWDETADADSYTVRRTVDGADADVVSEGKPATSFIDDEDALPDTACYTIAAVNIGGESPPSDRLCLTRRR